MATKLNADGTVTLDTTLQVAVSKTVDVAKLRERRRQLKDQISRLQENIANFREQLAQVKAEIAACVAAGAPSVPGDDNEGGGGELP